VIGPTTGRYLTCVQQERTAHSLEAQTMATTSQPRLYKTETMLKRRMRVAYPAGNGSLVLRTEQDWENDVAPVAVSDDGSTWTFELEADQPFLYYKPCLLRGGERHWAVGPNKLLLMQEDDKRIAYPWFFGSEHGRFSTLVEIRSALLDRVHKLRVYTPPGYDENTLAHYPVAFMQDGQNLFFPQDAFMGHEWQVDETSRTLAAMSAVEDVIFVGVYSEDRMRDYTRPGYERYAQSLAEEIVPQAQQRLRIVNHRRSRIVWGSSLGGVVSFYTVWQHPDVFGAAVCMSSTFSHKDNLMDRVLTERRRDVAFYLDSGWPGDNYEVTAGMAMALVARGWRYGHNLLHLAFPFAEHNEEAWGMRLHLPLQLLNGAVARSSRADAPVLGDDPWFAADGPSLPAELV
jgi:predicted alpha/beta superfamily hydrolase